MADSWRSSAVRNVVASWAIILVLKTLLSTWSNAAMATAVHYGTLAVLYPVEHASDAVRPRAVLFGAMTAVHTACGNLGLQLNGVGVMELVKAVMLPSTMAMQFVLYRVRVRRRAVLMGGGIVLASVLGCVHDWKHSRLSPRGLGAAAIYVVFNAGCRVLIKAWTRDGKVASTTDLMRQQAPSACIMTTLWALVVERPTLVIPSGTTWALLCLSAALAVRVNVSAFAVCGTGSPTAYALLAPIKTLGVVALANDWGSGALRPACLVSGAALGAALVYLGTGDGWDKAYTRPVRFHIVPWDGVVLALASLPAVPLWLTVVAACLRFAPSQLRMAMGYVAVGAWRVWPPKSQDEKTWGPLFAVALLGVAAALVIVAHARRPVASTVALGMALGVGTTLQWSPFARCTSLTRMQWGYTIQGLTNQRSMLAGMAERSHQGGGCWLVPCMQHSLPNVDGVELELLPYGATFNASLLKAAMQSVGVHAIQGACDSPVQQALAAVPRQRQLQHSQMFDLGGKADTVRTRAFWAGHAPIRDMIDHARAWAPPQPYAALHARIEDDWAVGTRKHWLMCLPACEYKNLTTLLAWAQNQSGLRAAPTLYVSTGIEHVSDPVALDVLNRGRRWVNWTLAVAPTKGNVTLTYLQHAVVDSLVCQQAVAFGGTPYSTFSLWVFSHLADPGAQQYRY